MKAGPACSSVQRSSSSHSCRPTPQENTSGEDSSSGANSAARYTPRSAIATSDAMCASAKLIAPRACNGSVQYRRTGRGRRVRLRGAVRHKHRHRHKQTKALHCFGVSHPKQARNPTLP